MVDRANTVKQETSSQRVHVLYDHTSGRNPLLSNKKLVVREYMYCMIIHLGGIHYCQTRN